MSNVTNEPNVLLATVVVSDKGLWAVTEKTEKLNNRATRHGMNRVVVTVTPLDPVRDDRTGCLLPQYRVDIAGCAPCINGYSLAAKLEKSDIVGTLVSVVPGDYADRDYSEFRSHDFGCDHCNSRRNRNSVFVLVGPDGCFKVVGRNCLADFLRCENAEDFARYAEFADEVGSWDNEGLSEYADEEYRSGRAGRPPVGLGLFLSATACCTRRMGWVSRTAARDSVDGAATADDALRLIYDDSPATAKWAAYHELTVNDGDADCADKAIEWAKALQPEQTDKSEYLHTIHKIAVTGLTDVKLAGYAASIIRAYQKDCEWAADRAEKAAGRKETGYLNDGVVTKTQDWGVVTVKRVRYTEGHYGVTTIVAMEADGPDGTIIPITWFASGSREFDENADYTLRAGIKGFEESDKWGKQTIVTRAKLEPVDPVETGCASCTEDRECPACAGPTEKTW